MKLRQSNINFTNYKISCSEVYFNDISINSIPIGEKSQSVNFMIIKQFMLLVVKKKKSKNLALRNLEIFKTLYVFAKF